MTPRLALLSILSLLSILAVSMLVADLGPHLSLSLTAACFAGQCLYLGHPIRDLAKGIISSLLKSHQALVILSLIGFTISTWNLSGTLPSLLSYGLSFFEPRWFLPSTFLACIVVSSFSGSSLSTCATIGVALMGVGLGLGTEPPLLAGAIISGAFFGDKMSPLSDTTNFAPSIVGVDLYDHIRSLSVSSWPALILSFIFYFYLGNAHTSSVADLGRLQDMQAALSNHFNITPWSFLPCILVLILATLRLPTVITLTSGIISAIICSYFLQDYFSDNWQALYSGVSLPIQQAEVARIVNRGGLENMFFTISLVIIALSFGGLLQVSGLIKNLQKQLAISTMSARGLRISSIFCAVLVNLITGEQYLSLLLPGELFKGAYTKLKIKMTYLSRSMEDGGTLVNPLIPWSVCGYFISSQLGVPVVDYFIYASFLYLCPVINILLSLRKS